jgi:hypothetical protein
VTSETVLSPAPLPAQAKRLRKRAVEAMESPLIVVCPQCGERFLIAREVPCADAALAERHGIWLLDKFVWDHIQENKHRSMIPLPSAEEMARNNRGHGG